MMVLEMSWNLFRSPCLLSTDKALSEEPNIDYVMEYIWI